MPSYTFTGQRNRPDMVPEGDYVAVVIDMKLGYTNNGKDKMELDFELEENKARIWKTFVFDEKSAWVLDNFVICMNMRNAAIGQQISFTEKRDVVGLRGWVHVVVEEYTPKNAPTEKRKSNKIDRFYTEKPKLERIPVDKILGKADEPDNGEDQTSEAQDAPGSDGEKSPF